MIRIISTRLTTSLQSQVGILNTNRSVISMVGIANRQYHHHNNVLSIEHTPKCNNHITILQPKYSGANKLIKSNISSESEAKDRVHNLITKSPKKVFVFMKGVPEEPACGYSNAVVQILNAYGVEYDSFNVLSDEKIRQEVKSYSNWPTIPQVYVDGSFVGGCDILIQMHQNNELESLFEGKSKPTSDTEDKKEK